MARKRGLGKGLEALIPEKNIDTSTENASQEKVEYIKLEDIKASVENPRKSFDEEGIKSLAESIRMYGLISPLVLIKKGDIYEIIAGERRYRAASLIDLKEVPAIVKNLSDKDKDMISMVENIQREDLNPYEEALAYKNVMKTYGLTQVELSELIGKTRTYIANIVRLLNLDKNTISELEKGSITSSQGRALLGVEDLSKRQKYLQMLINNEITVNELENKSKKNTSKKKQAKDLYIVDVEDRLKEVFGTKVTVKKSNKKWNVNLEFANDEQIQYFLEKYSLED